MTDLWILAQADQPAEEPEIITAEDIDTVEQTQTIIKQADPNATAARPKRPPQPQWSQVIFIVLIFMVLYFILFRGPRKRQQEQQRMIKSLKKNDRVQTIGGILGTVLDVSDNEITIKIDESNNTKIRVTPSAVSRVIEQK